MKVFQAALLLLVGTALVTLTSISFLFSGNPDPLLYIKALFISGLVFLVMSIRMFYKIHHLIPR